MNVSVRLFASLREHAGRDRIELALPPGATVADALAALRGRPGLGEVLARMPVRVAVNREYADEQTAIATDDELALIPPVSGGAPDGGAAVHARVSEQPLSPERLRRLVGRPGAGAIVAFTGTTRHVDRLEYEAYREMAEERISAILAQCLERHGLEAAAAEHRVGSVALGEPAVVVAVSAAHRGEAFAGAREAIDRIKAEAPIWKGEVERADGEERGRWAAGTVPDLTHLDETGAARMVDVSGKQETERVAVAEARLRASPDAARAIERGDGPKGEVLGTARIAGIQAAKRTDELIPLAHGLKLTFIDVEGLVQADQGLIVLRAEARTVGRTGVEIEAMLAASVAAVTAYDMAKALERGITIERVALLEKRGGRSGCWVRDETPGAPSESSGDHRARQ